METIWLKKEFPRNPQMMLKNFRVCSKSSGRWCNSKHNTSFGLTTLKARGFFFLGGGGGLNHIGKIEFSLNKC